MVPRCFRLWLIPVAVWAAALPFAFGQQNGAVFLKDGDHLALAPATFGASGFTLEAWLFVVDSSDSTVLDFGGGFFHPRVALQLRDGGKAELVVDNRPLAEQRGVLRTTEAFAKNRWMHLAAVFNASSGLAAIYWDGRLRAEGPMPVPLQYQRPEAYVGRSTQVGAPLTGLVDDVRVWSVARSRADLLDGVFKSLSGPIGGLLFSLSLDEDFDGLYTVVRDSSGRNGTATLNSSTSTTAQAVDYVVGLRTDAVAAEVWPGAQHSVEYRVSAWVLAESDGFGAVKFDGGPDVLGLAAFDAAGEALPTRRVSRPSAGFPAETGVWELVHADIEVTASAAPTTVVARFGNGAMVTQGRLFMTGLSLVRRCEGIPAGPALWLKADAMPNAASPQRNGEALPRWLDSSGNGVDAYAPETSRQPKLVSRAQAGLPVVRFDGSDDSMLFDTASLQLDRPMTVFLLARYTPGTSTSLHREILQGRFERYIICHYYSTIGLHATTWIGDREALGSDQTNWVLCTAQADNDFTRWWRDGSPRANLRSGLTSPSQLALGGTLARANSPSACDVAELLFYRRILTEPERVNVELYLARKWGLGESFLPETHAWTSTVPSKLRVHPDTPAADVAAATEASVDAIWTGLLETAMRDGTALGRSGMTWGRRLVGGTGSAALDSTAVLSLALRVRHAPFYAGMPFWLAVVDSRGSTAAGVAASAMPMHDACLVSGAGCGSIASYRVCFGGAKHAGQCDEVVQVAFDEWQTFTLPVADRMRAKYGVGVPTPSSLVVFLGVVAPKQVAEVLVDDIRVLTRGSAGGSDGACPRLSAYSLSGVSRAFAVPTSSLAAWSLRGATSSLAVTASAAGLRIAGTVPATAVASGGASGVTDFGLQLQEDSMTITSKQTFSPASIQRLRMRINAATTTSSGSRPTVTLCNGQVRLELDPSSSKFVYLHRNDGLSEPPSTFTQVLVDGQKSWKSDRTRNLGKILPYADQESFVFNIRITGVFGYYTGVFFRGGNPGLSYTQPDGSVIGGSADRQPAIWVRPSLPRLHVRQATTLANNEGCDPPDVLALGRWYHIAVVLEERTMVVYVDGVATCTATWTGARRRFDGPKTEPRDFWAVGHQSTSAFTELNDFRHYQQRLTSLQVSKLALASKSIDALSAMSAGSTLFREVACVLRPGAVALYEDGVLRLQREDGEAATSRSVSASSVGSKLGAGDVQMEVTVAQTPGDAISIDIDSATVDELREGARAPVFCKASGTYMLVAKLERTVAMHAEDGSVTAGEGSTGQPMDYAAARTLAGQQSFLGVTGHLATVATQGELDCVAALLASNCTIAWISGERKSTTGPSYAFADGPEAGQSVPAALAATSAGTNWWASAAGEPSLGSSDTRLVVHPTWCNAEGKTRLGQVGDCSESCGAQVRAAVVEFELPSQQVTQVARDADGATVVAVSSALSQSDMSNTGFSSEVIERAGGASSSTAARYAAAVDLMTANLLALQPKPYLLNGEADFIFGRADTSQDQVVVVDLGSVREVNRAGAYLSGSDRKVVDFFRVETSVTSASAGFTTWATRGESEAPGAVVDQITGREQFVYREDPVSARWVRFTFGRIQDGTSIGSRVQRLFVQRARPSLARLDVDGVEAVPSQAGITLAVIDPSTYSLKANASFPMDTVESRTEFARYLEEDVVAGDFVLAAARDMPSPKQLLFADNFDSSFLQAGINRRVVSDVGRGIFQLYSGATWQEMKSMCEGSGKTMCLKEHICRGGGWDNKNGWPHYGQNLDGEGFVATGDEADSWIAVGRAFSADDVCASFKELNGRAPTLAETRSWPESRVVCCEPQPVAPRWRLLFDEQIRNSTGSNNDLDKDRRQPPTYVTQSSNIRAYGYGWGNPNRPTTMYESWTVERCTSTYQQGISWALIDEAGAYAWTNVKMSLDVYQARYGMAFAVRWRSVGNYYRFFVDVSTNCITLARVRNGTATAIGPLKVSDLKSATWRHVEVTAIGHTFELALEGEVVFSATDPNPDAFLASGTAAVGWWMGYDNYMDEVRVEAVTGSAESDANVTRALRSIGVASSRGIDLGSWAAVGRKGAAPGTVPVGADQDSGFVEATTLFPCSSQSASLAENTRGDAPFPVTTHLGAGAQAFRVLPHTANRSAEVYGFDRAQYAANGTSTVLQSGSEPRAFAALELGKSTGQLGVNDPAMLDFEATPKLYAAISAQSEGFDSGYFKMGSQAEGAVFRELRHGLGASPATMDVRVTVRAVSGPNAGFEFQAFGGVFANDYYWWNRYGGVVAAVSSESVRLWAPSQGRLRGVSGSIINVGLGWGAEYANGAFSGEPFQQRAHLGEVRVRVSRMPPASFDSGWRTMHAKGSTASYAEVRHPLGKAPGRAKVLVRADTGPNAGFTFEAVGSAQSDNDLWSTSEQAAVVFGVSSSLVRIWAPDYHGSGAMIKTGEGWGNDIFSTVLASASVRVLLWEAVDVSPPDYDSKYFAMAANSDPLRQLALTGQGGEGITQLADAERSGVISQSRLPDLVEVAVTPKVGQNVGLQFTNFPMAQHSGYLTYWEYGGVLLSQNGTHARLMAPSPMEDSPSFPLSNARGYMLYVYDGWGGNINRNLETLADVRVRAWDSHPWATGDVTALVVTIRDVAEAPSASAVSLAVPENLPNGTVLLSLGVTDGDCPASFAGQPDLSDCGLQFVVESGNPDSALGFDASTGDVFVQREEAFNYEVRSVLAAVVRITDGRLHTYVMPRFEILNINDAPVLEPAVVYILEESELNTKVGPHLNATDEDEGQVLLFSIVAGNVDNAFKIGACDGQLRVRNPDAIDYEVRTNITLIVMVVDDHPTNPRNDTKPIVVQIINANDPPVIRPQTLFIPENTPLDDALAQVVATDQDGDALRYVVLAGDEREQFLLNETTGWLHVARAGLLDFEAPLSAGLGTFVLQVSVDDGEFQDNAAVTLVVTDAQDAPVFDPAPDRNNLFVLENSLGGSIVGSVTAVDQDVNDTITYAILSVVPAWAAPALELDGTTAQVTVAAAGAHLLDYETLTSIVLTVQASDSGGNHGQGPVLSVVGTFRVFVQDVNEPPSLEDASVEIAENEPFGTLVAQLNFSDPDVDGISEFAEKGLTFEVASGDPGSVFGFAKGGATNNLTVLNSAGLDFETQSNFVLTVTLVDSGSPPLNVSATVTVTVLDRNDPGRLVCNASLTGKWAYRGGPGFDAVSDLLPSPLDPTSADGTVTFVIATQLSAAEEALSLELRSDEASHAACAAACASNGACRGYTSFSWRHPAEALRGACVGRNAFADVLRHAPQSASIVRGAAKTDLCYQAALAEHSSAGTFIATLRAEDDEGDALSFEIEPSTNPAGGTLFSLAPGESEGPGRAKTSLLVGNASALDYEVLASPVLVQVAGRDAGSMTASAGWLALTLRDVNEPPRLRHTETLSRTLSEQTPAGQRIPPALGVWDQDRNSTVTFQLLSGNTNGWFAIGATDGMLTTAAAIPALSASENFLLAIRATDNAGATLDMNLSVVVSDQNVAPRFTNLADARSVLESAEVGAPLTGSAIAATDADNNPVRFALWGTPPAHPVTGDPLFAIDTQSGVLTVSAPLDFEVASSHSVTVAVTDEPDDGASAAITTLGDIVVQVIDVAEAPVGPVAGARLRAARAGGGTGPGGSVPDSALGSAFPLDSSGRLKLTMPENSAPGTVAGLRTLAWFDPDAASVSLSFRVTKAVVLQDVSALTGEPSPSGGEAGADVTSWFQAVNGTPTAQDVAGVSGAELPRWHGVSIRATAAATLNFEAARSFAVTVEASDGGLSSSETVVVTLLDVPEPPRILDPPAELSTYELDAGATVGRVVGLIPAFDADNGTVFSWRIARNYRSLGQDVFAVAPTGNPGQIFVAPGARLDFERTRSVNLTVTVADSAGAGALEASRQFSVTIRDVNDVEVESLRVLPSDPVLRAQVLAAEQAAAVSGAALPSPARMSTQGSDTCIVSGRNFGPTREWISANPGREESSGLRVTMGGPNATRYEASGCAVSQSVGIGNVEIVCVCPPGVGSSHVVRVEVLPLAGGAPQGAALSWPSASGALLASRTLSFHRPSVSGLASGFARVPTTGEGEFRLAGEAFGPVGHPYTFLSVRYEVPGLTPSYLAANCSVSVANDVISCGIVPGVGRDHTFVVSVGGQQSDPVVLPSAYREPVVSSLEVVGQASLPPSARHDIRSAGGSVVLLRGSSFGPDDGLTRRVATYGPGGSEWAVECQLVRPHTELRCGTQAGLAGPHKWFANVAGQRSVLPAPNTTRYDAPVIQHPGGVTGPGVQNGTTRGGSDAYVAGANFGPPVTLLPPALRVSWIVTYGPTGSEYTAVNCTSASASGTRLSCLTAPGVGLGHSWRVTTQACDSGGANCGSRTSSIAASGTSYGPPVIASVRGPGAFGSTAGGQEVVVEGENFGPDVTTVEWVRYAQLVDAEAGSLGEAGTSAGASSASGSGGSAGQGLADPGDEAEEDSEDTEDLLDGSTEGFLPLQAPPGYSARTSPMHFPRGPPLFQATNCTMTESHQQIRCLSSAGAGDRLQWRLSVAGQRSITPRYAYLPPVITGLEGPRVSNLSTAGGDIVFVRGTNLGRSEELGAVRYGPFTPACDVEVPHVLLRCVSVPGVGSGLSWTVTVAGQTSRESAASGLVSSYEAPVITTMRPQSLTAQQAASGGHDTRGGVRMALEGVGFGPPGSDVWVAFGSAPVRCDPATGLVVGAETAGQDAASTADGAPSPSGGGGVPTPSATGNVSGNSTGNGTLPGPSGPDPSELASASGCALVVSATSTKILFDTPAGQGAAVPVMVLAGGQASNQVLYSYSPPEIERLTVPDRASPFEAKRLVVTGSNFGPSPTALVVRLGVDAITVPVVPIPDEVRSHTLVVVGVFASEGAIRISAAGQLSQQRVFSEASPAILSVATRAGTGDVEAGSTSGGWIVSLRVKNAGRIPRGTATPTVEVSVGGRPCRTLDLPGSLPPGGVESNAQFELDTSALGGFEVQGDAIRLGTIECIAPQGQGAEAQVLVRHRGADDASEPATVAYLPPSSLVLIGDGAGGDASRGGDSTHWRDGVAGERITVRGLNLGVSPVAVLQRLKSDGSGGVAEEKLALPTEVIVNHTEVSGGTPFELRGSGFGEQYSSATGELTGYVTVGDDVAECSFWNDTLIRCVTPASGGQDLPVRVWAGSQPSFLATSPVFTYDAPEIDPLLTTAPWSANTSGLVQRSVAAAALDAVGDARAAAMLRAADAVVPADKVAAWRRGEFAQFSEPLAPLVLVPGASRRSLRASGRRSLQATGGSGGAGAALPKLDGDLVRGVLSLRGANFGTDGIVTVGPLTIPSGQARWWSHDQIIISLPEGQGEGHFVVVGAGRSTGQVQVTPVSPTLSLSYARPVVTSVSPGSSPTDACFQYERPTRQNRGADPRSGLPLRYCCQPALVTVTGENLGRVPEIDVSGVAVTELCQNVVRAGLTSSDDANNPAVVGNRCPSACDDELYAILHPNECGLSAATPGGGCCRYGSFPANLDDLDSCACPVPSTPCIVQRTHSLIAFRPPGGFGNQSRITVRVSGVDANPQPFAYDTPQVRRVTPIPYSALGGQTLQLEGINYGRGDPNVTIEIGESQCPSALWRFDATGLVAGGLPFLQCQAPVQEAGPKNATIDIGGVAGSVFAEEGLFVAVCLPGYYGGDGELCLPCPVGATCEGFGAEPVADPGWWKQALLTPNDVCPIERQQREVCPNIVPCEPKEACLGDNVCADLYEGERCARCVRGQAYRIAGLCEKCPDQPWIIVIGIVVAVMVLGAAGYLLNSRGLNMALIQISVDYFQVLAIFTSARVQWPPIIRDAFKFMSAFNLNLELAAPECISPDLDYEQKFLGIVGLPLCALALLVVVALAGYLWNTLVKRSKKGQRQSHVPGLIGAAVLLMLFIYMQETKTALDAFNCVQTNPPDGNTNGYLQAVFEPCYEPGGVHLRILPFAAMAVVVYSAGLPILLATVMWRGRHLIPYAQYLRAKGQELSPLSQSRAKAFYDSFRRLLYMFRPATYWWMLAVVARKFLIAVTSLMFNTQPGFQLSLTLLILFVSYTAQVQTRPYMSPGDRKLVVTNWNRREARRAEIAAAKREGRAPVISKALGGLADEFDDTLRPDEASKAADAVSEAVFAGGGTSSSTVAALGSRGIGSMSALQERRREAASMQLGELIYSRILDYNNFEGTLLSAAIFITLAGVCFESGRLDDEFYDLQRQILTWATLVVIGLSLLYMACVFLYDVIVTIQPARRATFCACLVDASRHREMRKQRRSVFQMANKLDGEEEDDAAAMSQEGWTRFREDFARVTQVLGTLEQQLALTTRSRDAEMERIKTQEAAAATFRASNRSRLRAGKSRRGVGPGASQSKRTFKQVRAAVSEGPEETEAETRPGKATDSRTLALAAASGGATGSASAAAAKAKAAGTAHGLASLRSKAKRRESSAAGALKLLSMAKTKGDGPLLRHTDGERDSDVVEADATLADLRD
ncbi:hypothetical protein FNF28_07019 [Cafeteria roenbergensis]|uniref:Cadherin domain-containing protein n=1 Tax=Cafeteria roenbergensis TaxID=33653 RepID=A0A5A8CHZ4_CAFRO|nr:hypothetical protein FNF28_07019 [Cafeteria roenbergensis]